MSKSLDTKIPLWRILTGLSILTVGFLSPLATPAIWELPISDALKTVISGALIFGIPEVLMIAGIAVMGKEAWDWIKLKLWSGLNFVSPQRVSKSRYYFGVILFSLCLIEGAVELNSTYIQSWVGSNTSIFQWSMNILFALSFFIAGGEFWDKIRAIFIYDPSK